MPNKIIDSNADSVNGNKAEWYMVNSTSMSVLAIKLFMSEQTNYT